MPVGVIRLAGSTVRVSSINRHHCFEIVTSGRVYVIAAEDSSEMSSWMQVLKQSISYFENGGSSLVVCCNFIYLNHQLRVKLQVKLRSPVVHNGTRLFWRKRTSRKRDTYSKRETISSKIGETASVYCTNPGCITTTPSRSVSHFWNLLNSFRTSCPWASLTWPPVMSQLSNRSNGSTISTFILLGGHTTSWLKVWRRQVVGCRQSKKCRNFTCNQNNVALNTNLCLPFPNNLQSQQLQPDPPALATTTKYLETCQQGR